MKLNMSAKNVYFGLVATCVFGFVALLGGVYAADTILKSKAQAVREARLQNLALEREQQQLAKAKTDIEKYRSLADIAQHIVPQDKDQAVTVREIVNIAKQHNIALGGVSFPSSSLGSSSKTTQSQMTAVKDIKGVYSMDITVQSDRNNPVTYPDLLAFLGALENNRRTALVKSVSLQPNTDKVGRVTFTLVLREYIKP